MVCAPGRLDDFLQRGVTWQGKISVGRSNVGFLETDSLDSRNVQFVMRGPDP